jgi:hypothetical protein
VTTDGVCKCSSLSGDGEIEIGPHTKTRTSELHGLLTGMTISMMDGSIVGKQEYQLMSGQNEGFQILSISAEVYT